MVSDSTATKKQLHLEEEKIEVFLKNFFLGKYQDTALSKIVAANNNLMHKTKHWQHLSIKDFYGNRIKNEKPYRIISMDIKIIDQQMALAEITLQIANNSIIESAFVGLIADENGAPIITNIVIQ